jgi:hypothetical protein
MPSLTAKDRVSLCLFTFTDGRRCRTPTHQQPSALLLLPRPKRIPIPGDGKARQRPSLFLLRRLPLRQRSKHGPRPSHPRRNPRRNQAPRRPHRSLHAPNSPPIHSPGPARIYQRLRHRRLARNRQLLHQLQPRPPLPARPQRPRPRERIRRRIRGRIQRRSRTATAHPRIVCRALACPARLSLSARPTDRASPHPPTLPSPADTEAAFNVARSIFPPAPNSSPAPPTVPATNPPTQPPPPPPKPTTPNRDPYEVRFDHTHRLLIDGKPW